MPDLELVLVPVQVRVPELGPVLVRVPERESVPVLADWEELQKDPLRLELADY